MMVIPAFSQNSPSCSRRITLVSDRDGIWAIVMRGGNTLKMGGAGKVIIVPCFHASRLRSQPSQQTHLGDESDT